MIKVGNVWYPNTKEGKQQAKEAFKMRQKAWITVRRKMEIYGRTRAAKEKK